jgi:hypothetical protein
MDERFFSSHFGYGILTWKIPCLFRTPPGYNLYVRGPTNWCKDGVAPLDGIVETDWAFSTFTMNWKITRPGLPIRFEKGEPICMIFPVPRGEIERFAPEVRNISDEHELEQHYNEWRQSRDEFNRRLRQSGTMKDWQKHYYVGKNLRGDAFTSHQVNLRLRKFRDTK